MSTKKLSSHQCLAIIYEAYKNDPEGLLDDLRITVESEEGLIEFAQSSLESIEMDEEGYDIETEEEEHNKFLPALVA